MDRNMRPPAIYQPRAPHPQQHHQLPPVYYPPPAPAPQPLPAPVLERIEQGILEILWRQSQAEAAGQDQASKTESRFEAIETELDQVHDDHQEFRLAIEKRVNRALWWLVSVIVTGLLGVLFALLRGKLG